MSDLDAELLQKVIDESIVFANEIEKERESDMKLMSVVIEESLDMARHGLDIAKMQIEDDESLDSILYKSMVEYIEYNSLIYEIVPMSHLRPDLIPEVVRNPNQIPNQIPNQKPNIIISQIVADRLKLKQCDNRIVKLLSLGTDIFAYGYVSAILQHPGCDNEYIYVDQVIYDYLTCNAKHDYPVTCEVDVCDSVAEHTAFTIELMPDSHKFLGILDPPAYIKFKLLRVCDYNLLWRGIKINIDGINYVVTRILYNQQPYSNICVNVKTMNFNVIFNVPIDFTLKYDENRVILSRENLRALRSAYFSNK